MYVEFARFLEPNVNKSPMFMNQDFRSGKISGIIPPLRGNKRIEEVFHIIRHYVPDRITRRYDPASNCPS